MHPILVVVVMGILIASLLPILGFGGGGIIFNSFAALWQSWIGNVTGGSLFSILQSLGAGAVGGRFFGQYGAIIIFLLCGAY